MTTLVERFQQWLKLVQLPVLILRGTVPGGAAPLPCGPADDEIDQWIASSDTMSEVIELKKQPASPAGDAGHIMYDGRVCSTYCNENGVETEYGFARRISLKILKNNPRNASKNVGELALLFRADAKAHIRRVFEHMQRTNKRLMTEAEATEHFFGELSATMLYQLEVNTLLFESLITIQPETLMGRVATLTHMHTLMTLPLGERTSEQNDKFVAAAMALCALEKSGCASRELKKRRTDEAAFEDTDS